MLVGVTEGNQDRANSASASRRLPSANMSPTAIRCWSRPAPAPASCAGDAAYRRGRRRRSPPTRPTVFAKADMIVKVKEPQPAEWVQLRPGQILFTYLHLAPDAAAGQRPDGIGRHRRRL